MADKFKISLLTGTDPQAQYDAITTKDMLTFYLLGNGIGYLGDIPLFGGGAQNTVVMASDALTIPEPGKLYVLDSVTYGEETLTGLYFYDGNTMSAYSDELFATYLSKILISDMSADGYSGDDKTVATTKAIMDLIGAKLSDSSIVNAAFFRKVESHTLTTDDLSNAAISLPEGAKEGDVGLLFTADTDDVDGNERYYFISLVKYLTSTYSVESSNSIEMSMSADNKISANIKIKEDEKSFKVDEENGGVYIEKTTAIDDSNPSTDKLVTESALVGYIQNSILTAVNEAIVESLADVVSYTIDDGTASSE